MPSPDENSFTYYTHYVCCCTEESDHACACTFRGPVKVIANRYGNPRTGRVQGSGYCPMCEEEFYFVDELSE